MGFFLAGGREKRSMDSVVSNAIDIISLGDSTFMSNFAGETALLQSDIFTATRIVAGDLASAEVEVEGNDHVKSLLSKRASKSVSGYNFKFALFANALLNENGFAEIVRDRSGQVVELVNLKGTQVNILESEEGELFYKVMRDSGEQDVLDGSRIIHLRPFSLNGLTGMSPLYSLTPELTMLKNGNNLLNGFFRRGANLGGILHLKDAHLDNASKATIRQKFEEANSGANNAGSVMVLDETQDYTPLEINTKVLDMIQNNKYSTQQIAKAFGIPLSRFGQELTNTSERDANDHYIVSTLNSYAQAFSQELEEKLGVSVDFNFSVLRGYDKQSLLVEAMKRNSGDGVLTVNEVRAFYGYDPIEGPSGDKVYKNSASVPVN